MVTIDGQMHNAECSSCVNKKPYSSPNLQVLGNVAEITLKVKGVRDHNESDSNDMGNSP